MSTYIRQAKNIFFNCNKKVQNVRNYGCKAKMPPCKFRPENYKGMSYDEMMHLQQKHIPKNLPSDYREPFPLAQGHMQWLFDIDGKRYLDLFGGICTVSVGHCHPTVIESVKKQISILGHVSNAYAYPLKFKYAEKLTEKMPGNLKVCYFVNSGSEANDLAVLLARAYTGRSEVISFQNAYHGATYLPRAFAGGGGFKFPVSPSLPGIHMAMFPDVFRGPWGGSHCTSCKIKSLRACCCGSNQCTAKDKYLTQLTQQIEITLPKNSLAGMLVESIQGLGGVKQFPKGFLNDAYKLVKKHGGLFISDEVQAGFGRTGDHFWGFEENDFIPDIVTIAKGIANGFPMGAVITTQEIATAFQKASVIHTYGANSMSCCAGLATLEVIDKYNFQENSKVFGAYFLDRLEELRCKYKIIGDIRGKGFMLGIEFITGKPKNIDPLPIAAFYDIWENCRKLGVIIGKGGIYSNIFRIAPPMCITKEDIDFTCDVLDEAICMYMNKNK